MKRIKDILKIDDSTLNALARGASDIKRSITNRKKMRWENREIIERLLGKDVILFLIDNGHKKIAWEVLEGIEDPHGNLLPDDEMPYDGCEPVVSYWEIDLTTFDAVRNVEELYFEFRVLDIDAVKELLDTIEAVITGKPFPDK